MWRTFFLLSMMVLMSAVCFAVQDSVNVYSPEYVDTILAANAPPIDMARFPEINPAQLSAFCRYDIQPIAHRSFKTLVFVVFILSLSIFLLVKFLYPDFYAASVEGFISLNFFNQSFRINEYGGAIPFLLMILFRCLVLSLGILLVWGVLHNRTWKGLEEVYYTIFMVIIVGTAMKNTLEYLFNFLSGSIGQTRPYFIQVNILYNVMYMFILPLLLILFFISDLSLKSVSVIGISWLLLSGLLYMIRSLQVMPARSIISYLHFILYICAFEIIPWLLIARVVWNETN